MDLMSLAAKLTLDSSDFEKGVRGANNTGKSLASSLEGTFSKIKKFAAGALSVAAIKKGVDALFNFANEVSTVGDRIDKQSQALGLSRKAYQEWDYILGQNGASIDSLGVSMKTLNSAILSAADGSKESMDAFSKLGLHLHEIENLSVEDQFDAVVRAFQKMPAGAKKSALAVQLFGRNGMELLPLLNQSETSLDELRARAEELGIIMSDDAVDASVAYNDALDDLSRTFNGLKYAVGAKLLPTLTKAFGNITSYAGKISRAYQENGLKGVWDTLVEDFRKIKWPTWDQVKTAITDGWNSIKEGVQNLGKIVFGEDVDFADVGGLVAKFDDWWTNTARPAIQNAATWVLQLFGVPVESAQKIGEIISDWWNSKVEYLSGLLKWFLNIPGEPHDAGTQLHDIVVGWWKNVVGGVQKLLSWALGIPEIEDKDGEFLTAMIKIWWDRIKGGVQSVLSWALGIPIPQDADGGTTSALIKAWWDQNVVPKLKGALDFVLGLFGLPSFTEMVDKIKGWWELVKKGVGDLVLNIGTQILGLPAGDSSTPVTPGMDWGEQWNGQFAKGLNDVPYNGYVAKLHRGEMILNASRARQYREGNGGVDMSALIPQLAGAIRDSMQDVTVRSYLSGRDVTEDVNRNTVRQLKARRFAT